MKLTDLHYQKIYNTTDERIYLALVALERKELRAQNLVLTVNLDTGVETITPITDDGN